MQLHTAVSSFRVQIMPKMGIITLFFLKVLPPIRIYSICTTTLHLATQLHGVTLLQVYFSLSVLQMCVNL